MISRTSSEWKIFDARDSLDPQPVDPCERPGESDSPRAADLTPVSPHASNAGPCVDLYAPAHDVKVAYPGVNIDYDYRPAGMSSSGTSFSAPYVAGIAARLQQWNFETHGNYFSPSNMHNYIIYLAQTLPPDFDNDGVNANDVLAKIPWDY